MTNAGGVGAQRPVLGFYPHQVEALTNLAKAITSIVGIPFALPKATSETSVGGITRGFDSRVAGGAFRGVCGHYHLKATKVDPGVTLWPALLAAGAVAS